MRLGQEARPFSALAYFAAYYGSFLPHSNLVEKNARLTGILKDRNVCCLLHIILHTITSKSFWETSQIYYGNCLLHLNLVEEIALKRNSHSSIPRLDQNKSVRLVIYITGRALININLVTSNFSEVHVDHGATGTH